MRKIIRCALLLAVMNACVPVIIGAAVAGHSSSNKTKQKWTADFNQTNIDRQKQHLPPLDYCEELLKFNKSWAKDNKECKEQLKKEGKI